MNLESKDRNVIPSKNITAGSNQVLNSNDFGIRTKIPGVEGSFAVIATDNNGRIYIAYQGHWNEDTNEDERHIYFAYSHDFGKIWSKSYRIDDNGTNSVRCDSPCISVDQNNGNIFIAWKDNRSGEAKVYIDKSTNRGVSFGADTLVADCPNDYIPPWLPYTVNIQISNNSTIFISWIAYYNNSETTECNICFSHSTDSGQTFQTPIIINQIESGAVFTHPSIASINNTIYVVYSKRNQTSSNIYLAKSQDRILFSKPIRVNDVTTARYTGGPKIAISQNGTIHIVWTDNRAGMGTQYLDIYYAESLDEGLTFIPNIRINNDNIVSSPSDDPHFTRGAQGSPSMVVDNNSIVHIFWEDFRNYISENTYCRDIYYASSNIDPRFSNNLKVNYVPPEVESVNCADPSIAIDFKGNFYLVYSDAPSGDNNHHEIYFQSFQIKIYSSSPASGFHLISLLISYFFLIIFSKKRIFSSRIGKKRS